MTAVYVLGIVFLVLLALSALRVGAWVEFGEGGLLVKLRVGAVSVPVFPAKEKKEKPQKEKGVQKAPGPKKDTIALVKEFLPVVADAAGRLKRKIRIDDFKLDLIWGASDPVSCAMGYGAANAAAGMIWPLIEQNFNVKNHRIRTAVDFERGKPAVFILAAATLTVGQVVAFAVAVGSRALRAYRNVPVKQDGKITTEQKEAV